MLELERSAFDARVGMRRALPIVIPHDRLPGDDTTTWPARIGTPR